MNSRIIDQFRAAGRLVNEWRDSLTYTVLAAYTAHEICSTGNVSAALAAGFAGMAVRETIRSVAWQLNQEKQIAGLQTSKINPAKFWQSAASAAYVGVVLRSAVEMAGAGLGESLGSSIVFSLAALGAATFCCMAGGPRAVAKSYETMWDYPRKRGGGGKTQTQKVKDSFERLALGAFGRMQPVPVQRLVYIPANARKHVLAVA